MAGAGRGAGAGGMVRERLATTGGAVGAWAAATGAARGRSNERRTAGAITIAGGGTPLYT